MLIELISDIFAEYDSYTYDEAYDSKEEAIKALSELSNAELIEQLKVIKATGYESLKLDYALTQLSK